MVSSSAGRVDSCGDSAMRSCSGNMASMEGDCRCCSTMMGCTQEGIMPRSSPHTSMSVADCSAGSVRSSPVHYSLGGAALDGCHSIIIRELLFVVTALMCMADPVPSSPKWALVPKRALFCRTSSFTPYKIKEVTEAVHTVVWNMLQPVRLHWNSNMSPVLDARQHGGWGLLRYVPLLPTKHWCVKPPIYHAIGINDVMHALHATPVAAALGLPMSNPARRPQQQRRRSRTLGGGGHMRSPPIGNHLATLLIGSDRARQYSQHPLVVIGFIGLGFNQPYTLHPKGHPLESSLHIAPGQTAGVLVLQLGVLLHKEMRPAARKRVGHSHDQLDCHGNCRQLARSSDRKKKDSIVVRTVWTLQIGMG